MQVKVSNDIINWVLAQTENDTIEPKYLDMLYKWQNNEKKPTFNQVEQVSKATGIPFGYFFLNNPPAEDVTLLEYRTINSTDNGWMSRNLKDTIHDMKSVQEWMKDYGKQQNQEPLDFVGSQVNQQNVKNFAKYIRGILGIEDNWSTTQKTANESFNYLRNRISEIGVIIMMNGVVGNNTHRALSLEEFRAFTLIDEYAPLIFINSNDSYNGRLFSLVHEFVHILIGESSLYNSGNDNYVDVSKTEKICNAVAAEIIIPEDIFIKKWDESLNNSPIDLINSIAKFFNCGTVVVARRALDKGFINDSQYDEVVEKAIEAYKCLKANRNGGGDYYRTKATKIDHRFLNYLIQSVQEGYTLYSDAFRLTNTNRKTFNNLAMSVGGLV